MGLTVPTPLWQVEGMVPCGSWPGLGVALPSQVAQKQCQELQDKLAASEAVVRAQAEQLEKYHVLLREWRGGWDVCPALRALCMHPTCGGSLS